MKWLDFVSELLSPKLYMAELQRKAAEAFEDRQKVLRDLARDGWKLAQYEPPIGLGDVMFTRDGLETYVSSWERLPPELNVAGLWWRPLRATIEIT